MKILHVIPFLSAESGGPAVSTLLPVRYLNGMGKDIEILTFRPSSRETVISDESFIRYLPELKGWRGRAGVGEKCRYRCLSYTGTLVVSGLFDCTHGL